MIFVFLSFSYDTKKIIEMIVFIDKDSNITMRFKDVKSFNKHDPQILLMNSVEDNQDRPLIIII